MSNLDNRGYWNWIPITYVLPPSMTLSEADKDNEAYHGAWTRNFLAGQIRDQVNDFRAEYTANMAYATDSRWGESSDIKMFLGDGAAITSRIPFKQPLMSPMLTRMIGGVDNISITAKAEPATQWFAQTRKENKFMEVMNMSTLSASGPNMEGVYAPMGISPNPEETESMFDMTYQDHIARGANSIMSILAERNKLDKTKRIQAGYTALSGLSAFHNFINGSNIETEVCEPRELGVDPSCLRPDASDGQYIYVCPLMDVGAIAERWNPKAEVVAALDNWARQFPGGESFQAGWPQSRPRVITMYWKDMKRVDRGFVIKDGEPHFCTINENNPDTGKPDYTDVDLITPPENRYTNAWSDSEKRNKKQSRVVAQIRYCTMIPWEYLPGSYTKSQQFGTGFRPPAAPPGTRLKNLNITGDLILDYGVYPLQEADPDDEFSVKFPVKVSGWRYYGGNFVAPITAARDPQRWSNQITSDVAWRLRKAGGKAVMIAKEALVDSNMDEQDVKNAVKEGDTMVLSGAQLGGLQNSHGAVDASPDASTYQMMNLIPQAKAVAESAIGVYESNYGAPSGSGQLVGTMQLQLQQAGVMQQPFYACIADLYEQQNQFYAQAGKQFYSRMPWVMAQMTGDEDMEAILESKDMMLEQFRVKVVMAPDGAQQKLMTDRELIPGLLQLGMLDPITASQLMGRSTPDDVYAASRKFTKMAQKAAADQAQQAEMQAAQAQMDIEHAGIADEEADIAKQETDANLKAAALQQKLAQPAASAEAKWLEPPSDPSVGMP